MKDGCIHLARPGRPGAAMVFAFHGTGGDEHQFPGLVADLLPGAAIVSPRGDVSEHGASRFFRRAGEGVYDMDDLARRTAAMGDFIAAHRAGHAGPVIGLGYSNGANILASVLLGRPALFDAAVLMHPLIPWQPQPGLAGRAILITAGRRDPICPAPLTRALVDRLAADGAEVALVWHEGGHEVAPEELDAIGAFLKEQGRDR